VAQAQVDTGAIERHKAATIGRLIE
jgi:hypothetical protein